MNKLRESDIQGAILEYLEQKHVFHWRNNAGKMFGEYKGKKWAVKLGVKGSPDIFAVVKGQIYGIEVKNQKDNLSDDQQEYAMNLSLAGGVYIVARSLEDVTAFL